MRAIVICKVSSFPDPGRKVVEFDGTEVGVFCVNGKFTAFENVCPHMGGRSVRVRSIRACKR
jgi:nitrite reductase/ring-hydroxylating ferredoxin subunit